MKNKRNAYGMVLIGLCLFIPGLCLIRVWKDAQGILLTLPYVMIGLGCGLFGHGSGELLSRRSMKNNPQLEKQYQIDVHDERNVTIANRSKAKAYDMMIYVFGALMLAFALMQVDLNVILLFVGAYLFVLSYGVYFRFKYDKEM